MDQNMHFDPFLGKVLTEPSELTPQEQSYDFWKFRKFFLGLGLSFIKNVPSSVPGQLN